MAQQQTAEQIAAYNAFARGAVLSSGVEAIQNILSTSIATAQTPVLNITPRNVGILRTFTIVVRANITTPAGVVLTRTDFGPANLLSRIQFNDLNNNVRVNTTGWHLAFLSDARRNSLSGSNITTDNPQSVSATPVFVAPASIPASSSNIPVSWVYEVPIAYGMDDLRGAIYAAVVNANMNLSLSFNQSPIVLAAANGLGAVYKASAAGATISNYTIDVYQHYIDQLPMGQGGPIVPVRDLSTLYLIQDTNLNGLSVGQEFAVAYANFRDFLSTMVLFDNGGVLNPGSDVNYFTLQSANFTNIFKVDPRFQAFQHRNKNGTDYPPGVYYFDTRRKPISSVQFGNMQLMVNPSQVNANAQLLVGFESFGQTGQIVGAASVAVA